MPKTYYLVITGMNMAEVGLELDRGVDGFSERLRYPLWVKGRHSGRCNWCPLYPQKRTLL